MEEAGVAARKKAEFARKAGRRQVRFRHPCAAAGILVHPAEFVLALKELRPSLCFRVRPLAGPSQGALPSGERPGSTQFVVL